MVAGREIFSSPHVAPEKRMGLSFAAPLAGRDQGLLRNSKRRLHFNPRTPCGVRPLRSGFCRRMHNFNPRTPCGVRRARLTPCLTAVRFQSTHPLRGATIVVRLYLWQYSGFQSTHPLRGATYANGRGWRLCVDFNPRTPCGVRPLFFADVVDIKYISIHAPLAGCDVSVSATVTPAAADFNPRTPCGVRPNQGCTPIIK